MYDQQTSRWVHHVFRWWGNRGNAWLQKTKMNINIWPRVPCSTVADNKVLPMTAWSLPTCRCRFTFPACMAKTLRGLCTNFPKGAFLCCSGHCISIIQPLNLEDAIFSFELSCSSEPWLGSSVEFNYSCDLNCSGRDHVTTNQPRSSWGSSFNRCY